MFRRRRLSGLFVAALVIAVYGVVQTTVVASASPGNDQNAPRMTGTPTVVSATASAIIIAWEPARDNGAVAGYGVYVNDQIQSTTDKPTAVVSGLRCGTSYSLAVDAFDAAQNRSDRTDPTIVVSTAACVDTDPPTTPSGFRQSATTESTIVLTWPGSTDKTGVVGYGVYVAGLRVLEVRESSATLDRLSCGTSYALGVDAYDAAGNRSALGTVLATTAPCPAKPWTSSLSEGAVIASGTVWTVTFQQRPDAVDFWASGKMIKTDTTAPFDVALNLPAGEQKLGFCYRTNGQQTCAGQDRDGIVHIVNVAAPTATTTPPPSATPARRRPAAVGDDPAAVGDDPAGDDDFAVDELVE